MSMIRCRPLPPSEAERAVALVWQILERDNLVSPHLTVKALRSSVIISLAFTSSGDALVVREGLRHLGQNLESEEGEDDRSSVGSPVHLDVVLVEDRR